MLWPADLGEQYVNLMGRTVYSPVTNNYILPTIQVKMTYKIRKLIE